MPVAAKKALAKTAQKITKQIQTAKVPAGKKSAPLTKMAGKGAKPGKRVYSFGAGKGDGDGSMKPLLGGKGANLAEMSRIGLPVPPGFTITTEVCTYFYDNKRTYPPELDAQMRAAMAGMEKIMGTKFGDTGQHPAAGGGAIGGARLDAGHDGHDPEPGSERPEPCWRWPRRPATSVSPGIVTAGSSRCTATWCMGVQKRRKRRSRAV